MMSEVPVPATHTMTLVGQVESGAEEWVCPRCGRRMLLRWPPDYQKLVLDEGDDKTLGREDRPACREESLDEAIVKR